MPSPFFGLNTQSANPTVRRYLGLSATTVGNTFGTAEGADEGQPLNRVIQFGSQNTFLALLRDRVYRSTDAGSTWTTVFTFGSYTTSPSTSGLNVVYRNGLPTVCFVWANPALTYIYGSYSTDGTNWTTDNGVLLSYTYVFTKDTIFRNTLYTVAGTVIISYTPGSDVSKIDLLVGSYFPQATSLCVFNDQLVVSTIVGYDPTYEYLYVLAGGTLAHRISFPSGTFRYNTSITGMFVDGNSGSLIVFTRKNISDSWVCYSVTDSWTYTDISAAVLPTGMTTSVGNTARVLTFVDGAANPGTDPDKYIIYANNPTTGTPLSLYKWNGVGTKMSDLDSGSTVREAFTLSNDCQGVGNWSSGENSVSLINRSPVSGGVRLFFKLYSASGLANVSVRAWFGSQFHEYPLTQATIVDPSNGTIVGNVNSGVAGPPGPTTVVADNGATTYYFTWNNAADGISTGSRFRMILEVFV